MATSGQFPGKVGAAAAGSGTGKDPRASTALPGTSKPAPSTQRQGGGSGGISPGKIIIGGVIFLVVMVVANMVFLTLQEARAKNESEYNLAGTESEIKAKLAELSTEVNDLKKMQIDQKKEMDKLRGEVKSSRSQIDYLQAREMAHPK